LKAETEDIPLKPLAELIWRFKKRNRILTIAVAISLPGSAVSILLFGVFALAIGFTSWNVFVFIFLFLSAIISLVAFLWIPDSLSDIMSQIEASIQSVAFTITPPQGQNPQERILNQLIKTDYLIRSLLKMKPASATINAEIKGKKGKLHSFDVYIRDEPSILRRIAGSTGIHIFVKRFDQIEPVIVPMITELKDNISDVLKNTNQKVPTRVLVISTSDFDGSVFRYVDGREGSFRKRFTNLECKIELIKENADDTFAVLRF
jgi:hypothetical protein